MSRGSGRWRTLLWTVPLGLVLAAALVGVVWVRNGGISVDWPAVGVVVVVAAVPSIRFVGRDLGRDAGARARDRGRRPD